MSKVYVIKRINHKTDLFGDNYSYNEILGVCSNKEIAKEHIRAHARIEEKALSEDDLEFHTKDEHDGWIIDIIGPLFEYRFGCEEYEMDKLDRDIVDGYGMIETNEEEVNVQG